MDTGLNAGAHHTDPLGVTPTSGLCGQSGADAGSKVGQIALILQDRHDLTSLCRQGQHDTVARCQPLAGIIVKPRCNFNHKHGVSGDMTVFDVTIALCVGKTEIPHWR